MRRRHRRTLEQMRARPTPADIRWEEIESLLYALGVRLVERAGSRVQLVKGVESIVVHRPHPRPAARRDTVRDIARFIDRTGES
ncbi:MAG: type II toxin-antitoxin system HicA family toxin [Chloroflexi bacterium]|nr:type II toxin-antitoxin system HicA family toxin [Chloroflexota bacterium]